MITWAIVPVKPLRRGKSRLAGVFTPAERLQLNRYLLSHTLEILQQVPHIEHTLVVSRDTEALALARHYGARTLNEGSNSHLNLALKRAAYLALASRVPAILVVPADLPMLNTEDVAAMITPAEHISKLVIAPDYHEEGTNALLLRPPNLLDFQFGAQSFSRHLEAARKNNTPTEIIRRPGLLYDLDNASDLERLRLALPADLLPALPTM